MGPVLSPTDVPCTVAPLRLTPDQIVQLLAELDVARQMVRSLLSARPVQTIKATFPELDEETEASRPRVAVRTLWDLQNREAAA